MSLEFVRKGRLAKKNSIDSANVWHRKGRLVKQNNQYWLG